MPSTQAPTRRARPHRRSSERPAHLARPTGPARWDPPTRVEPGQAPEEPVDDHVAARHFGTTALPARHHWILDTLMVAGGLVVLLLLFV